MEIQYFLPPKAAAEASERCRSEGLDGSVGLAIPADRLRFREHAKNELAHYAARAVDVEFAFPFGWKEMEGIHNRTDYDLRRHSEHSGKDLSYYDDLTKERFIPHIVETSGGADRG